MSYRKVSRDTSPLRQVFKGLVVTAATIMILGAAGATGRAILENIRFAKATDQILQLVASGHALAGRDKNFATRQDSDLLDDLTRAGLIANTITDNHPYSIMNPWQLLVHASTPQASYMRIDDDVPEQDCRRLALFFIKNGGDLGLARAETRKSDQEPWLPFFDASDVGAGGQGSGPLATPAPRQIEAACSTSPTLTVGFIFKIR